MFALILFTYYTVTVFSVIVDLARYYENRDRSHDDGGWPPQAP